MSEKKNEPKPAVSAAAANSSENKSSNAEKENPAYKLANGSDQVAQQNDMHALANGTDNSSKASTKNLGNAAGAAALNQTADKLQALMADQQTEALNLDDVTKERYATLITLLRKYAQENKAFLSTNKEDFPEDILQDDAVAGQYEVWSDTLYLRKGPEDTDAFNTIVHEISHAGNKESADLERYKAFALKWGKEKNDSAEYLRDNSDMLLSKVVFELEGEIDGEILENIQRNKDEPGHTDTFKLKIDMWNSRKYKEGSSARAFEAWNENIDKMVELSEKDETFIFDAFSYKKAAENYIIKGGEFPSLAKAKGQ